MSVNRYLLELVDFVGVDDGEKLGLKKSISTLQERLNTSLGQEIVDSFIFGSYSRGTILPRSVDQNSDVDLMVVFADPYNRPQTYLDRLRRFVESSYAKSEIAQSAPAIVLSLNHINFELVPARKSRWSGGLKIPVKSLCGDDWMDTDPKGFNDKLSSVNTKFSGLIKPLVRIIKYWNAKNGYLFESFFIEQKVVEIVESAESIFDESPKSICAHFYRFVDRFDIGYMEAERKRELIHKLKDFVQCVQSLENKGFAAEAAAAFAEFLPLPCELSEE